MINEILNHVFNVIIGMIAGIFVVLFVYFFGWLISNSKQKSEFEHNIVLGSSSAVLWCWYSVNLGIGLLLAIKAVILFVIILIFIKFALLSKSADYGFPSLSLTIEFLYKYTLFYIIGYVFMMPYPSDNFLPIVRAGNNDILNYLVTSSYLQRLGPSNIAGFSFIDSASMISSFTPAVFDAIEGVAMIFNGETIIAIMPTIFGFLALIGCIITTLAQRAFLLSSGLAVGVAAVLISGPFLRYIIGNYFLSTLVGVLFVLLVLSRTVDELLTKTKTQFFNLVLGFVPYYFLIFYSYPPLLIIGIVLQIGFIFIYAHLLYILQPVGRVLYIECVLTIFSWIVMALSSILIIGLIDPDHFRSVTNLLSHLSTKGTGGWALDFISPFAVIGAPILLEIHELVYQLFTITVFLLSISILGYFYFKASKFCNILIGGTFYVLSSLSFIGYFVYYFLIGPSYQQWKLASYLPLFISFSFISAIASIVVANANEIKAQKLKIYVLGACAILVAANMAVHIMRDPPLERFSSKYANLKALDLIEPKEIFVKMSNFSSTFFPIYYNKNKILHFITPSYFPLEFLKFHDISPIKPLFVEGDPCELGGDNISIKDVGCLYVAPPSMRNDRRYLFSKEIPGLISSKGLSAVESWGRWSDTNIVELNFLIEKKFLSENVSYINIEVQPFIFKSSSSQGLSVTLNGRNSFIGVVTQPVWISLPFDLDFLTGFEKRELILKFNLPDAIAPHDYDINIGETRKLGLGFVAISLTNKPQGAVLLPKP